MSSDKAAVIADQRKGCKPLPFFGLKRQIKRREKRLPATRETSCGDFLGHCKPLKISNVHLVASPNPRPKWPDDYVELKNGAKCDL